MLDAEQEVLAQTAQLVFRNIVLGAPEIYASNREALTQLYDSTLDSVREALFRELCAQSARLFPPYRLPNELWCLIWRQLPQDDRIRVAQVCHDWRSLALSSAAVWSDLRFVTSRHASHVCTCADCLPIPRDAYHCPSCDAVLPSLPPNVWRGSSNLRTVVALLPRSLAHPLSVTVCAETPDCPCSDASELILLAEALRPHMHHLSSLQCYLNSDDNLYDFMSALAVFPALTHLKCQLSFTSPDGEETLGHDAYFPSLQTVELYGSVQNLARRTFSAVRSLACDYVTSEQFLGVISTFPELSSLHVRMRPAGSESAFVESLCQDVQNFTKLIACVTVAGISARMVNAVLFMFHQRSRQMLTLCCEPGTDNAKDAFLVCAALRRGVHLSCEAHEGNEGPVRIIVADERQRMRIVYCHEHDACNIWDHLAPTSLRSVTIDLRLPYETFSGFVTRAPNTKELVLILPDHADIAPLLNRIVDVTLQPAPKFESLRIKSAGPRTILSVEAMDAFLTWLQVPRSLLTLHSGVTFGAKDGLSVAKHMY